MVKAQLRRALLAHPRARVVIERADRRANFNLSSRDVALVWLSGDARLREQPCDGTFYAVDDQLRREFQSRGMSRKLAALLENVGRSGYFSSVISRTKYFYYTEVQVAGDPTDLPRVPARPQSLAGK